MPSLSPVLLSQFLCFLGFSEGLFSLSLQCQARWRGCAPALMDISATVPLWNQWSVPNAESWSVDLGLAGLWTWNLDLDLVMFLKS